MNIYRSRWMLGGLAGLVLLLAPMPAFSQSCALCYTQAAASGSRMIQALKSGILILIAPPTLGSVGVVFVLYRKRNQVRRTDSDVSGKDEGADTDSRSLRDDWQKTSGRNNDPRNCDRRNHDW